MACPGECRDHQSKKGRLLVGTGPFWRSDSARLFGGGHFHRGRARGATAARLGRLFVGIVRRSDVERGRQAIGVDAIALILGRRGFDLRIPTRATAALGRRGVGGDHGFGALGERFALCDRIGAMLAGNLDRRLLRLEAGPADAVLALRAVVTLRAKLEGSDEGTP